MVSTAAEAAAMKWARIYETHHLAAPALEGEAEACLDVEWAQWRLSTALRICTADFGKISHEQ